MVTHGFYVDSVVGKDEGDVVVFNALGGNVAHVELTAALHATDCLNFDGGYGPVRVNDSDIGSLAVGNLSFEALRLDINLYALLGFAAPFHVGGFTEVYWILGPTGVRDFSYRFTARGTNGAAPPLARIIAVYKA